MAKIKESELKKLKEQEEKKAAILPRFRNTASTDT